MRVLGGRFAGRYLGRRSRFQTVGFGHNFGVGLTIESVVGNLKMTLVFSCGIACTLDRLGAMFGV